MSDLPGRVAAGESGRKEREEEARDDLRRLVKRVLARVDELSWAMEKWNIAEFHEYYRHPRRILFISFVSGLVRGLGMAIGFTLLGALVLYLARVAIIYNLPGIGHFLAQLIRIINEDLRLRP